MIRRFSLQALASALAGAGLGLFVWMGISVALLQANSGNLVALRSLQHTGLVIAGLLTLASLVNLRACPTASGIKWRQITAGALVLTLSSAVAVLILLSLWTPTPGWTALCAALLSIGAIATTLGLGMCATTSSHANWQRQMVAPGFLAYALLAGATVLFALIALKWPGQGLLSMPAVSLVTLAVMVAATKVLYWSENGSLRAGVQGLADNLALPLRVVILALLAVIPALLTLALVLWPGFFPRTGWSLVALSILAGGYLERQLLAAEAATPRDPPKQTPAAKQKSGKTEQ